MFVAFINWLNLQFKFEWQTGEVHQAGEGKLGPRDLADGQLQVVHLLADPDRQKRSGKEVPLRGGTRRQRRRIEEVFR